ncbi:cupin domain-containing protein [Parvibaculum sp.]|jgi:transcriptional regulator with XRE-family HTH domain|uniref:cupin domain-containing protein n=1 Tax=Parvibaculum sp. TaxID=2024848 RepID=UPI002FD8A5B6
MAGDFRRAHSSVPDAGAGGNDTDGQDLGVRLRELRKMYGLSQRELAKRAGVTNGTISLIEQSRISPSIGSLKKVLGGFPISIADFLTLDMSPRAKVFYQAKDLREIAGGDVSFRLVGRDTRDRAIQMMHERYVPGADTGEEMLSHAGEECGIVISGVLELTVGGESRRLVPGDAYYFNSRLPHRFQNPGTVDCVVVSACTPPSF